MGCQRKKATFKAILFIFLTLRKKHPSNVQVPPELLSACPLFSTPGKQVILGPGGGSFFFFFFAVADMAHSLR